MQNYQIKNVEIGRLRPHENICGIHLGKLEAEIKIDGVVKDPIIVDRETLVILDGHHRYNALKSMGYLFCPCCLVDYLNDQTITVGPWREGEFMSKELVIGAGITGRLLTPKTSRHSICDRPTGLNIPLDQLK